MLTLRRGFGRTIERGCELLAPDSWKPERQNRIVGHGGRGRFDVVKRVGVSNQILRHINRLGYICQPPQTGRHE